MAKEITYKKLRNFNLFMGFLHAAQGVIMLVLSTDFSLPVKTNFIGFDPVSKTLTTQPETVFNLRIGPLVASFLFLSAIAHFSISLIPAVNRWYNANLAKGANYARWIEYSVSSSIMIVVVSMLTGMYDGVSLMLVFFLNVMMILFGWMMELLNQYTKKTDWTPFAFGSLAGIIPWVAVALYLFGSANEFGRAPDFVYWIFFSIFIFFNVFAVNMILQYKKVGPWKNYLYGERMYIILSLVAKSLLAWQVWAGTLRPL